MFKKPFQSKPRTALKSSVCRRLIQETKEQYPAAWSKLEQVHMSEAADKDDDDDVEAEAEADGEEQGDKPAAAESDSSHMATPMPSKLQAAKFVSHIGEKGEIYYDGAGQPLWFRAEPHGDSNNKRLLPTVYTQWQFPDMLPILWTWPPVVTKLINGADLMTPGLIIPPEGLQDLKKGAIVAVCCSGNLAAQAIGVLNFDTKDVHSVVGAKGKAVLVSHTYNDSLWEAGDKTKIPEIRAKAGVPDAANSGELDSDAEEDEADGDDEPQEQCAGELARGSSKEDKRDAGFAAAETTDSAIGAAEADPETEINTKAEAAAAAEISPAEMDVLLMEALKQVMATVLAAEHAASLLPINASTVYSNYMVVNAPRGKELDIKRSGYKKLAKFLKAAEKHGLVKLKDIRGESHIKSFDWKHKDMREFQPYRVGRAKSDKPAGDSAAHSGQRADAAKKAQAESGAGAIQIVELVKPSQALAPLFTDVGAQTSSGFFTRQEARAVLEQYIKGQDLIDPKNPRNVKLDHRLCDGLLTREECAKMSTMPRDKLQARLQEKMTLYTQLVFPDGRPSAPKIGNPTSVEIVCEKKMGNKVFTRVIGLEPYGFEPAAIAKELRTICASSTGVDPIPGKKNAQSVHAQGHQVAAVSKLLEKHGLPARLLKVTDKTGKAPKKQ
ncbi:hypothetical protein GGI07_001806 [Coemansia sp. Benny D115]|nr:hypothetical protein GGI07_001806 [Coemansia sp. Benny D115]